jgi:oligoribonuclease
VTTPNAPVEHLLWLDLEMSGLDVTQCRIIEAAAIVTDMQLNELDTYEAIVYQEPAVLEAMDEWCTRVHGESGLTEAVATGTPEAQVEAELIAFCGKYWKRSARAVLAGNSIGQDRKFVDAYWPDLAAKLHYRMLDVSSWKIMLKGRFDVDFGKAGAHRALGDIRESINELRHYLKLIDVSRLDV